MKKLLIGLTIILSSLCSMAQPSCSYTEALKSISLNVSSIALEMVGDGLLDEGRQIGNQNMMAWGHTLQGTSVAVLLSKPLFQKKLDNRSIAADIASYGFIRFGIANPAYNITRDLPLFYAGTTSFTDNFINKTKSPNSWRGIYHGLSFVIGGSIALNEIYPSKWQNSVRHRKIN